MQLILIDAVYLDGRDHGFNDGHHALAYVAVECKITAERLDSVSTQNILDLEIRRAHFHVGFCIVAAGNNAAIVIAEHHNRHLGQVRSENALTAGVERIAIDQAKDRRWLVTQSL
ncbi:hypothetical protein ALQ48_200082 [Pseudomonas coronafaciens pv. zizaniae]|nr:hypothetical protein ALQ48_200082 [Pseudomonas coronafaciens pv. zizaniae]